jgi:Recombination endonuclease VII
MTATAYGDGFAGTRLRRDSGKKTEDHTPVRHWCPATDRPDHLWWGHHCQLDKTMQTVYGITCDDYHRLLERQGGQCSLCGGRPRKWRLVPHHSHETGEVLALLHFTCNRMIDPLMWLLPRLVHLLVDPPGRELGLVVPAAKMRRLEAKDQTKQTKTRTNNRPKQQTRSTSFADQIRNQEGTT